MVRFKDTDFLHVSARLRSREKRLLAQRQLNQMIEAPTHDEAWKLANDAGVGAGRPYTEYEEALAESLGETYAFLREHAGGFAGGFVMRQGDVSSNCTFEVLVGQVRETLEKETANLLFGDS